MSERDADSSLPEPLRTVTEPYTSRPDMEMDVIGWLIALVLVVVVLPLVPFLLLFWLASKTVEFVGRQTS
ncbi:hypothetical protein BV210_09990 [Halorientalis sp. IM1011]|uniref:DUF7535 family protein n=1 Tax=Halorientalis sp. IM1011 TaxID=1932360 RepID=UPI00097CC146|nr:hypothetical protein [Halorientalis sp. IM1011]AQL43027.1 hypothetical protein BV210_09990 [Halorientalis sp. IM1011]